MAAERWFLKIDGIDGESTDAAHKNEIDVESWSWGLTNTGSAGGGGGGAGRATFVDFHFVARISKASPALFLSSATGAHAKQARLTGVRGSGKHEGVDFYKVDLSDVLVSSYHQDDSAEAVPTDQFSLNFTKIEVSYSAQGKSGKLESPITAGYDLKANKKV